MERRRGNWEGGDCAQPELLYMEEAGVERRKEAGDEVGIIVNPPNSLKKQNILKYIQQSNIT